MYKSTGREMAERCYKQAIQHLENYYVYNISSENAEDAENDLSLIIKRIEIHKHALALLPADAVDFGTDIERKGIGK